LRRRRETHEHARTRARRAVRSTRTPTRARTHAHTRTRARAHTHTHTYLLLLRPIAIGRLHVGLSATILDEQEIFASKDFGTSDTCHLLARGGVRGGFIVGMAALDCRQRPRSRLAACAPARILYYRRKKVLPRARVSPPATCPIDKRGLRARQPEFFTSAARIRYERGSCSAARVTHILTLLNSAY